MLDVGEYEILSDGPAVVRTNPSVFAATVARLDKGDRFRVIDDRGQLGSGRIWSMVSVVSNGATGWLAVNDPKINFRGWKLE